MNYIFTRNPHNPDLSHNEIDFSLETFEELLSLLGELGDEEEPEV